MFEWPKKKNARPQASEVMARAIILKCMFVKTLTSPPSDYLAECRKRWTKDEWNKFVDGERTKNLQLIERLHQDGFWNSMGQRERNFMEAGSTELTQQARIDASWSVESIVCLLWALRYVHELPAYDQQADPELTNKLPTESAEILLREAGLRPHELIDKQRDLAELWHWRSRTRQLQESKFKFELPNRMTIEKVIAMVSTKAAMDDVIPAPIEDDFQAFGKAYRDLTQKEYSHATSIAVERHRALNWLCGLAPGNRWEETPTET